VVSCQLIPNPETGKHKGYGFIEFEEDKSAAEAIEVMNGFELVGRQLKVGPAHSTTQPIPEAIIQASAPPSSANLLPVAATAALLASGGIGGGVPVGPSAAMAQAQAQAAAAAAMAAATANVNNPAVAAAAAMQAHLAANAEHGTIAREENLRISSSDRSALMQKLSRDHQSPVILLKNMVKPEEVDADLENEVKEECEKFGPVAQVVVHQNRPLKAVHIFVCYQSSGMLLSPIHGRLPFLIKF
jgi:poly(U)-binding-splicing factor PUF60